MCFKNGKKDINIEKKDEKLNSVMHYHGIPREETHLYILLGNKYRIERKQNFDLKFEVYLEHLGKNGMLILKNLEICNICKFFCKKNLNSFYLYKSGIFSKCKYCEKELFIVKYCKKPFINSKYYGSNIKIVHKPDKIYYGPIKWEKKSIFTSQRCFYFDGVDLFYIHSSLKGNNNFFFLKKVGGNLIKCGDEKIFKSKCADNKNIFYYEFICLKSAIVGKKV